MRTFVLIISNLFLISAAPVDQPHDIEARSASEEGGLQDLIIQMRDTLANVNRPPIAQPTTRPIGLQVQDPSPQVQTYVLNPVPPVVPPLNPRPAQQPSGAQVNLYISGLPDQGRPTAAGQVQVPLQQPGLPTLGVMPAGQSQVVPLPASFSSILPQNSIMLPLTMPTQMYPQMISPLQGSAFFGMQANPYFQPLSPHLGPQRFGPNPFQPQLYPLNPYMNYGMPNVAVSPPIIFRERGHTVTTQV